MKYAVIQLAGKQYRVAEGEELVINKLDLKEGEEQKVTDVLLTVDGEDVVMGAPLVKNAFVTIKAISTGKADKIRVAKFKSKSRYRRVRGHRQVETTVSILKLG